MVWRFRRWSLSQHDLGEEEHFQVLDQGLDVDITGLPTRSPGARRLTSIGACPLR